MPTLDDPVSIGGVDVPNRLYRAPLLECAGNGPDAVDTLVAELEPTAASGVGLVFQGASIVTPEGGCAAPNMTRVHDPDFVDRLSRLTGTVHDHGGRIFLQLGHGGLRSQAVWHAGYRAERPDHREPAVSRPPWQLRALDRLGLVDLAPDVMTTQEVYDLAERFGRAAGYAVDAGYDGIHLSGANMGIVQQFLSPLYNRRDDEFGPGDGPPAGPGGDPSAGAGISSTPSGGVRFLAAIHDSVREHAGDVPLVTKVPAETASPGFVRRFLTKAETVRIAERVVEVGYDAVVPVEVSTFWDMSVVRGVYPERAWADTGLQEGYAAAFGGPLRARAVRALNRLQSRRFSRTTAWNADLCRAVRERVDVPVLCEGGIRERATCDDLLSGDRSSNGASAGDGSSDGASAGDGSSDGASAGDGSSDEGPACDLVGMGRPFYAEPKLGRRLLSEAARERDARALCASCNNCTVPQVTGAPGRCRTPSVVRERGRLEREGVYEE